VTPGSHDVNSAGTPSSVTSADDRSNLAATAPRSSRSSARGVRLPVAPPTYTASTRRPAHHGSSSWSPSRVTSRVTRRRSRLSYASCGNVQKPQPSTVGAHWVWGISPISSGRAASGVTHAGSTGRPCSSREPSRQRPSPACSSGVIG
jgi:hypothetical protein